MFGNRDNLELNRTLLSATSLSKVGFINALTDPFVIDEPIKRGIGIGRALTEACIECARAAGYVQLELEAVAENEMEHAIRTKELPRRRRAPFSQYCRMSAEARGRSLPPNALGP